VSNSRLQFWVLYLTRFAGGFGFITLVTLLPQYIEVLDPSAVTVLGLTVGAGIVIGLFTTGFTLAQTVAVVPLAWAGDRYDKRLVLLGLLAVGAVVYAGFALVASPGGFIAVRAMQGVVVTGAGLMSLSLVGQLADAGTRANHIGKANASRFAASILGSLSAGVLYDAYSRRSSRSFRSCWRPRRSASGSCWTTTRRASGGSRSPTSPSTAGSSR
jgi:MFS family permease